MCRQARARPICVKQADVRRMKKSQMLAARHRQDRRREVGHPHRGAPGLLGLTHSAMSSAMAIDVGIVERVPEQFFATCQKTGSAIMPS